MLAFSCDASTDAPAGGSGKAPAVMLSTVVRSPEGSSMYVGAFPELPRGQVDLARMREIPGGNDARAFDGHVFVWDPESAVYTRYAVDDALNLSEDGAVSFANLGGSGNVMTQFISSTRAYSLTRRNLEIIVWNPSAMQVLGSISVPEGIDPNYAELDYGEPALFGDYVAWPINWGDSKALRFKPELAVILAKANSEEPALIARDRRCGGGWSLFVDDAGDLYATGNAWFGFAHFFGAERAAQPRDCVLRIKKGSTQFDPAYQVDLNTATQSPAVYHTWHERGHSLFAAVVDPADDPAKLASPDEYWSSPLLRKLVRIDEGASTEVVGIPKSAVWSTLNYRLDNTLFMLASDDQTAAGQTGKSRLYRIDGDRAAEHLTVAGDIWSIGRIR